MEKITTNREIFKITKMDSNEEREFTSPDGLRTTYDSPGRMSKLNNDIYEVNHYTNTANTPLIQNYNAPDSKNNMKELKLFSKIDR